MTDVYDKDGMLEDPGSAAAAQAAKQVPEGWVPCTITYAEGEDPEEVAFGPQRMMDRLKKWLDSYFAKVYAERYPAASLASAAEAGQVEAHWTIIAPDGWKLTGDKPIALIVEANKHEREINPAEADRQKTNLMESIAEEQAEHERDRAELVNRFLRWKLPADFSPDAGITFKRVYNETSLFGPQNHEPTGTNLLSGAQARAMLDFVLDCDEGDRELAHRPLATTPASPQAPCAEQCWACAESGIGCNLVNDCAQAPAPQAVVGEASEDPYFGVQDEVCLTRAVCVMNDVLTDISGWEDQALAEAVKSSKVDLCAMIECIRMRADDSYVPGTKPIDGEVCTPSPAPSAAPHQGADALREALAELVALKDMKERVELIRAGHTFMTDAQEEADSLEQEYGARKPLAWAAARAALAQHQPQQGEQR